MFKIVAMILGIVAGSDQPRPVGELVSDPAFTTEAECKTQGKEFLDQKVPELEKILASKGIKYTGIAAMCVQDKDAPKKEDGSI